MREHFTQLTYVAATVLFILGLRSLTRPDKARQGMQMAAVGMLLAVCGTLVNHEIVDYRWIAAGLVVGAVIGYPLGMWVPTTALPQRIAVSLSFGALAAVLVGVSEYYNAMHGMSEAIGTARMAALGFEVLLGSLTVTGALVAFGKLQEVLPSKPLTFPGQNVVNGLLFLTAFVLLVVVIASPAQSAAFYTMIAIATVLGVLMVIPIGGADMPVVVALLNSYCGLAAAATGFALGNSILIICGALDGASGFLLSMLMSKAMNRSFANVLFGAFGGDQPKAVGGGTALPVRSISADDAAIQLAYASRVIIVPGYGMAVAQAQHQVRELAELIEKRGGEVKYAIHPVAGRMPGHMNVLLAEANVPYDRLYDMEEINAEFPQTDVVLVIGANDVVNPAARDDPTSPIYGMPILDVDRAKTVIVLKRGMAAGFAGIENMLFHSPSTSMLFGDAKASLAKLVSEVKAA
ncbi:MAG TPA: NAD(P)(+) transhydrogenase (Re/Si-specific) subunit beta [Gemmatimonadaceae bacterium]|jgi:NAD(P) transhydrogenase subunit beta|nr:NAD(P)(+) transhydrogenase (Re/Si-specific) subunit beta [Gemmatimonadaceae bacterium]